MIRVIGQLVKGSDDDLEKAKHVTDIHFQIVQQFLRLRRLKPQNVDEVDEANALSLLKKMKKDPIKAEEFKKAIVPWPRETEMCVLKQRLALTEGIVAEYGSVKISPPVLNMQKLGKEIEEYIELSFISGANASSETAIDALVGVVLLGI